MDDSDTVSAEKATTWSANRAACVATYNALGNKQLLDQFNQTKHPFAAAESLVMKSLDYWPHAGQKDQLHHRANIIAFEFFVCIKKVYTPMQENDVSYNKAIAAFFEIFVDEAKTLLDLANAVDDAFKFPNE